MLERTRLLGPELIAALERADEVLESHDGVKRHAWKDQDAVIHLARAIVHLGNAILDKEDGAEIEASHGVVRAIMGLTKIIEATPTRSLCSSHAKFQDAREQVHVKLRDMQFGSSVL